MDIGAGAMKGRVLILTGAVPDGPGGVEHFVREAVVALGDRGYAVEVFHEGNAVSAWVKSWKGKIGQRLKSNLLGYFVAKRARQVMAADVVAVISNGDLGWCAPSPTSVGGKKVHVYHGTYRAQAEAIRPFISRRGYMYLKWWSSDVLERLGGLRGLVLSNSNQTRDEVQEFFGYRSHVVWLPLDLDLFKPRDRRESRRQLGLTTDGVLGLFIGSANPAKGFDRVRQMMHALPEIQWMLVMSGDVPSDVESSGHARVFRSVSEKDLPSIYSAADFSVCPSYYESFGYVVAEALACGIPVIASPGGASREFLANGLLDRLVIPNPWSVEQAVGVVRGIASAPETYRQEITESVRPKLVELLSRKNWSSRFFEATGL